MKQLKKYLVLFIVSGSLYYSIEWIWKTFFTTGSICHWSMALLGGTCFLLIGSINEYISWGMPLVLQGTIGAVVITVLEFIFGCALNLRLGLGVWDYSHLPFNILGQICLPFSFIWFFFSILIILLDDYLRWKWFDEEKPHYKLI